MSTNPALQSTRAALAAAQQRLGDWAVDALRSAGLPITGLSIGAPPPTGDHVLLLPLRIGTPGRSLDGGGTPLIAPPDATRDAPRHMAPAWGELARAIQLRVDALMPRLDPRTQRPAQSPLLTALPGPLAAWYQQAPPGWCSADDPPRVRPPTLSWSAGTTLRVDYLLALAAPPKDVVPGMGVLSAALLHEGGIEVPGEPVALDGPLDSFVEALAAALPDEGDPLRALLVAARTPPPLRVALGFASDLSTPEIARIMAHYGVTAYPYLTPALQLLTGAQLTFAPTAYPNLSSRPRRPGDAP